MAGWNLADVFETVAASVPDRPALVQGDSRPSWAAFDARANGVAATFLSAGLERGDKVAQYLFNCPEYLEVMSAAMKVSLVPVNTNYRYGPDELVYLWDNADVIAVVFHGCFAETIEATRMRTPRVRLWLWVEDGSGPCPSWATPYEDAASSSPIGFTAPWLRSPDDPVLIYTGGTTGLPKGVIWRQDDLFMIFAARSSSRYADEQDLDAIRTGVSVIPPRHIPAAPLMHGAGLLSCLSVLVRGGAIALLESHSFDPIELLDAIERENVQSVTWVGDAFAKPVLSQLDAYPGRWDLSSLRVVHSSGVMFGEETKRGILRHCSQVSIIDGFGSTEGAIVGQACSTRDAITETARFSPGSGVRVLTDDDRDIKPGSAEIGRLAVSGRLPIGYYKDPTKTAETFRDLGGVRHTFLGDYATVEADGSITLLGRGSACINTGGEKVFPEEVEETLKLHTSVRDAVVVGVPDDRFGEAIVALVEPVAEHELDCGEVIAFVRSRLASYKAPRQLVLVDVVARTPAGKVDYDEARRTAKTRLLSKAAKQVHD